MKKYIFDKQIIEHRGVGYTPPNHFTTEAEIKAELNKQRYVVSKIIKVEGYICTVTSKVKAHKTVQQLQKEIDKLK